MNRSIANSDEGNVYSQRWFEFFHARIDEARTIRETEFICRFAPLPEFRKILDVCCGMGRHARALSQRGYLVTGIDRDADAIAKARELSGGRNYVVADIHDYQPEAGAFDAAIVMGQSFGHFDAETNRDILRRLAGGVRKRGRVVLDLWNPEFFAAHEGERELETARGVVRENKRVDDDRLFVELDYPDGAREQFEWQLFTPAEIKQLANSVGLGLLVSCTDFDTKQIPSPSNPRIQFVLEAM
ncbi:MAG TPA: class I SAM-dependent methyltransferase [Chthoniobacterales bacterium]|nr:class I SAM-dependent methyltransferase [Chthoniobacterales bacterium]